MPTSPLINKIRQLMASRDTIPFETFMEQALYAPEGGYYSCSWHQLGRYGDYITGPELTPLFSQCLASCCADILPDLGGNLLEFGAGSGQMAADLLLALERQQKLPQNYHILDISPALVARQQATIQAQCPHLYHLVSWVNAIPEHFTGVVLANEVLDAMPTHRFHIDAQQQIQTYHVQWQDGFTWHLTDPTKALLTAVERLQPQPPGPYDSEINLRQGPWIAELADHIQQAVVLLLDYGHNRTTYYHPDRRQGTLQCYHQHRVHSDPLQHPGEQDITAHVDFTAIAEAATQAGLSLLGYTSQASFLIDCGLLDHLAAIKEPSTYWQASQAVKVLTMPSEMGETCKVMALGKQVDATTMQRFFVRDRAYELSN